MKKLFLPAVFVAVFFAQVSAQTAPIFPKGEIAIINNHSGTVWLTELNRPDDAVDIAVANATFAPSAKLDWHIHPAGQILLITDGTGYYQEKGKPIQVVHKGDVIKRVPGMAHWHGAAPKSSFTYVALSTNSAKNKTVWLQRVTDAEYNSAKN